MRRFFGADDRARTGDLDLGKVALYQLSYVRVASIVAQVFAEPKPFTPYVALEAAPRRFLRTVARPQTSRSATWHDTM
jgi:hypothetical protein